MAIHLGAVAVSTRWIINDESLYSCILRLPESSHCSQCSGSFELPPALYTKLQVQLDKKNIKHINESRETITTQVVNALRKAGITGLPSIQKLCNPTLLQVQDVGNASNVLQVKISHWSHFLHRNEYGVWQIKA